MYKILLFFFLLCSSTVFAQPSSAKVVEVDGKKYYEHVVEAGNTMWGLQRLYGVTSEDLLKSNASLAQGLKLGQKVLIPVKVIEIQPPEIKTTDYKVRKKETLYGLSKKFNVSVDQLVALNPELNDGLRKGQIIKVPFIEEEVEIVTPEVEEPSYNPFVTDTIVNASTKQELAITFSDTTINHVVLAHETMYSISKRFMVTIERIMKINDQRILSKNIKFGQSYGESKVGSETLFELQYTFVL